MSSSTCESDGPRPNRDQEDVAGVEGTPRSKRTDLRAKGRRVARKPASERFLLWIPTLLLLLATLAVLLPWNRRQGARQGAPQPPTGAWFRVGRGDTEFLEEQAEFTALRRASRDELYRIEIAEHVAFESPRLDEVFQLFLQYRLGGLQPRERLEFRFWLDPGVGVPRSHLPSAPLIWEIQITEEPRDSELWYRAPHGRTGEPLYARSLEAIKIRLTREIARDVKAVLGGELIPR